MNDKESPIYSMNVSFGTPQSSKNGRPEEPLQPWIVLVCSDLGFLSQMPQRISAATLSEFFENNSIIISGTVQTGLPSDIAPFYVEYPAGDIKDFTASAIGEKLPLLKKLKNASALLDALAGNRIHPSEGLRRIAAMELPQSIVRQLGAIAVSDTGPDTELHRQPVQSSKVDSILSMMDIDAPSPPAVVQQQPTDFVAALTEGGKPAYSTAAILSCKEAVDSLVVTLANVVAEQPFFKAAASSWNALKMLLKTAGRNRDLHVFLHSAPFDAAERHFADALSGCIASGEYTTSGGIPDLVVWDYPVTIDNASMQQLEQIGATADRYKSAVLTSLYYRDDLYKKIIDGEPLRAVIEQPACSALRRLQTSGSSRCLTLCAPDALMQRSNGDQQQPVSGAWLLALQWTLSFIENRSPFHLQNSSVTVLDGFTFPKLSHETVSDANRYGITVLKPNGITSPRVLFGDANSPYSSLLFNMMVNRTARLAATWISGQDKSLSCNQVAPLLAAYLVEQLAPYTILEAHNSISVTAEDEQDLKVAVDSAATVAAFPVRFEFTFGCRD
jgi:hypothetical protein